MDENPYQAPQEFDKRPAGRAWSTFWKSFWYDEEWCLIVALVIASPMFYMMWLRAVSR